ncbi:MAG: hypothetical protein WCF84_04330, partial [Anaerolineae bacterium]
VLLAYVLLRRYLAEPLRSAAVALMAVNSSIAAFAGVAVSETAFIFFMLAFLVLLERWYEKRRLWTIETVPAILALAALISIRYQGMALAGAALLFLVLGRRYRQAFALVLGVGLVILPLFAWAVSLQNSAAPSPGKLTVSAVLLKQLSAVVYNLPISLVTYWQAVPYILVPLLGPQSSNAASLAGSIFTAAMNTLVLSILAVGVWHGLARWQLPAICVTVYFVLLLVLTQHPNNSAAVFDEPRYSTVMLPFLYLYLVVGAAEIVRRLQGVLARLSHGQVTPRRLQLMAMAVVLFVLGARNIQQARGDYPVDLASGAAAISAASRADAIVMTPNPIQRYLYLRRKTVRFPLDGNVTGFMQKLAEQHVSYVVVAPSLATQTSPVPFVDPYIAQVVTPAIQAFPDRFRMIYQDSASRTQVYELLSP